MEEGKKWSQLKDSETFAFIAMLGIVILVLILILSSCNSVKAQEEDDDESIYIEMSDGNKLKLVADEYGNQYLRQNAGTVYIYIPYLGQTEDQSDTLKFFNTKNK